MTIYNYFDRASRIVNRVLPEWESQHGFYAPQEFAVVSRRNGERKRLTYRIAAKLRAKAEGGYPYIEMPRNCDHLWGPGDAMYDVAQELAEQAMACEEPRAAESYLLGVFA